MLTRQPGQRCTAVKLLRIFTAWNVLYYFRILVLLSLCINGNTTWKFVVVNAVLRWLIDNGRSLRPIATCLFPEGLDCYRRQRQQEIEAATLVIEAADNIEHLNMFLKTNW